MNKFVIISKELPYEEFTKDYVLDVLANVYTDKQLAVVKDWPEDSILKVFLTHKSWYENAHEGNTQDVYAICKEVVEDFPTIELVYNDYEQKSRTSRRNSLSEI